MKSFYNEFLKSCSQEVVSYVQSYDYTANTIESLAVPAEPAKEAPPGVYTSFSGCDIVVGIDGKIIGEMLSLKYAKLEKHMADSIVSNSDYFDRNMVSKCPVALELKFNVFDRAIELPDTFNISIAFANEYGQKNHMSIFKASPLWRYSEFSIDKVTTDLTVACCAVDITQMNKDIAVRIDYDYDTHYANAFDVSELDDIHETKRKCRQFLGMANHYANHCILFTEAIHSLGVKDTEVLIKQEDFKIKSILIKRFDKYYKVE